MLMSLKVNVQQSNKQNIIQFKLSSFFVSHLNSEMSNFTHLFCKIRENVYIYTKKIKVSLNPICILIIAKSNSQRHEVQDVHSGDK